MPLFAAYPPPRRAQRGAIGIFGVLALVITLAFAVLAVDTGRLALEKRRLQEIADLAAVDAVQRAGMCSGSESMTAASARAAAQQSAVRNGYEGDLNSETDAVLLGTVSSDAGIRQFTASAEAAASAVQVTARKQALRSLMAGGWYGGTVNLQATAVAQRQPWASFWVGSFLASIDSEDDAAVINAVLGELLGSAVSLDLLSYQGLANADITLAQLIDGAAVAGVSLDTNTVAGLLSVQVTAGEFLAIMASALGADSDGDATAATPIGTLQAAATAGGTFQIGDLLNVTTENPESALEVAVNAYSLGVAAIQIGRRNETLSIPITTTLPLGVGAVTATLHITEAPQFAIGPPGRDAGGNWRTSAHSGQLRLQIDAPLTVQVLGLVNVSLDLALAAEAARADAWLASIQCANPNQLAHRVSIGAQPGLAAIGVGRYADIADPASAQSPVIATATLGGAPLTEISLSALLELNGATQALIYDVSRAAPLPQQQTASTELGTALDNATQSLATSLEPASDPPVNLPLLGLTDDAIEAALRAALSPLLTALDEAVLDPVLRGLGVHVGGADVELVDLQQVDARLVR